VIDRATGKNISILEPGEVFEVTFDSSTGKYTVSGPDFEPAAVDGPVLFSPSSPENLFRVESLLRTFSGNKVPLYRGALEVNRRSNTAANRVNLVNIVELENYVKGVVANESIASFHVEALKAQATAARGYAVANIKPAQTYDVVDSSSSQVYRGVISEHPNAVAATEATRGLVASYDGRIISALYSSSFGGHSDNNEWIFNSPSTSLPGTNVTPYLRGIYDGEPPVLDLTDPAVHQYFWSVIQPQGYDMCGRVNNRFSRWKITLSAATIKSRLTGSRYVRISGDLSGSITSIDIAKRMEGSGRIAVVRINLTSGVVEVRGWDNMRNVLGRTSESTPSVCPAPSNGAIAANFTLTNPSILEPFTDSNGNFAGVIAYGGGWGHNTGLSQYGAHGRGLAGQNFLQILKAYYTGVDVGSYPIDIGREPGSGPPTLRQQFSAPNAAGTLVVRAKDLKKLVVQINEAYDIALNEAELAAGTVTVDISPYLVAGLNTIQYNPVGRDGTATVHVNIE
jgi:SpoIID/LytB domain protein